MKKVVVSRFVVEGFHCWPGAPGQFSYLGTRHRHLFHFEVRTAVTDPNRQIEFIQLARECREMYQHPHEFDGQSCERIAMNLLSCLIGKEIPVVSVSVFEDGENGAEVSW